MTGVQNKKVSTSWNLDVETRKGVVIHNPKALLDNYKRKAKFFVVVENPPYRRGRVLVCMTTSQHANSNSPNYVKVDTPFLKYGYTSIILSECYDIRLHILGRYSKVGVLFDKDIAKINLMAKHDPLLPHYKKIRILKGKVKKEEGNAGCYKMLDADQIKIIKEKLK